MLTPNSTAKKFRKRTVAIATAALAVASAVIATHTPAHARGQHDSTSASATTTLTDQTDLNVTVYNSNIALVRDVRNLTLPTGNFRLKFEDIAATVNPATVHFRSLTDASKLNVLEQNYEYDLLDPAKLLHKYVGKEVTLVHMYIDNGSGTLKREEVKATLLSDNNGQVWKIGNDIVTGEYGQSFRFPEVPANLYDHPTLLMSLENSGAQKQQIEASYLANALSWNSDYVLTVNRDDKAADLDGWVTLSNNSGTAFHNARLQLVAGDLNRVQDSRKLMRVMESVNVAGAAAPAQFQQENFSEYHLYTLGRRTSIENQETKQISLLQGSAVPVEKIFVVNGQNFYYHNYQNPGSPLKDPVMVYYKFRNEEKSGLGMPLPAGSVRVYQKDSKGGVLFVGEDRIDHTPKDEDVSIHVGNAFDIVSERKQTDFKKIANNVYEMEFEITLRNHKDTAITVQCNEPIGGTWEILSSSYKFSKTAAWAAQFDVPVDKNGTSVLKYRIRVTY
ncbi:MAG TPA: DUF4139 domain-containing protein [Candidatus Eremiobacteraceae bacterium]|jgi:hypothetical protein|nr:DUF4139 domain-containing protein [Candidatus Eremiobacteraceae bacterium]